MSRGRHADDWGRWYLEIDKRAENMAMTYGGGRLPVSLKRVADKQRIKVVFRPMLISGFLTSRNAGFTMYVQGDAKQTDELHRRLADESPRPLPSHIRFTIAHEIGHAMLFDITNGRPPSTDEGDGVIEKLEALCNFAASRLLLPKEFLQKELSGQPSLLEPGLLRSVATRAVVSPETVVYRFTPLSSWLNEDAAITCVQKEGSRFIIHAISLHGELAQKYPALRKGFPIDSLIGKADDFILNGGTNECAEIVLPLMVGAEQRKKQKFVIRSEPTNRKWKWQKYFFTIQRSGEPF